MCFETAGSVRSNGLASSLTVASPCARRARIARRVEFASTAKVSLRRSSSMDPLIGGRYFPYRLIYHSGNHGQCAKLRKETKAIDAVPVLDDSAVDNPN